MEATNISNNGAAVVKIKSPRFGPNKKEATNQEGFIFNRELFTAEYNSLRSEILQRIAQQTTLYQIAITAFGVIIGYALQRGDDINGWFNSVMIISVYPFLALLLSYAWAFNQIRICQIAQYLREREKEVTQIAGLIWWENHIIREPSILTGRKGYPKHVKNKPGSMILAGTQLASILLALVLFLTDIFTKGVLFEKSILRSEVARLWLASLLLVVNSAIMLHTFHNIRKSGGG